jgi:hypothetical protein
MSGGETPARARIKVKDEAELERWRKLALRLAEKRRREDATKSGRAKSGRAKRESVVCVPKL